MREESEFLEILDEIRFIASQQGGRISTNEIKNYLSGVDFGGTKRDSVPCDIVIWDAAKLDAICRYLSLKGVNVEGYAFRPDASDMEAMAGDATNRTEDENSEKDYAKKRAEGNRRIYRNEIGNLKLPDEEGLSKIIEAFLKGDASAKNKLIESKLTYVMNRASKYKRRCAAIKNTVSIDDVIAQGNVGLLSGVSIVEKNSERYYTDDGLVDCIAVHAAIDAEIDAAIRDMLDYAFERSDWEDAVLAKANLLHEAAKFMAQELERLPSRMELAEYTGVSTEEIDNIMSLSKDAARIAK